MSIFALLVLLAAIGFFSWLLVTYVPMIPALKTVIVVAACLIAVLLILDAMGFSLLGPQVPRLR